MKKTFDEHLLNYFGNECICDHCRQSFKNKGSLVTHMEMHNGYEKFQCGICNQCFNDVLDSNAHMCWQ